MHRNVGLGVVAACLLVAAGAAAAKNDIRGVVTAQPLQDALGTLELDGAHCAPATGRDPVVCTYDDQNAITLYPGVAGSPVEKIVYTFKFGDLQAVRDRLQKLYGLRKDRIEGEHRLFTGERFLVDLDKSGTGSLSIINDSQIRRDQSRR